MKTAQFRKELIKIMPGYNWTVHRHIRLSRLSATGIQSSGTNRMSTLHVIREEKDDHIQYEVKSSGFGTRTPWLSDYEDSTLARALRGLQDHYEYMASEYSRHASDLQNARKSG